jgi:hypothetical protein
MLKRSWAGEASTPTLAFIVLGKKPLRTWAALASVEVLARRPHQHVSWVGPQVAAYDFRFHPHVCARIIVKPRAAVIVANSALAVPLIAKIFRTAGVAMADGRRASPHTFRRQDDAGEPSGPIAPC